jgi:acyl-CoA hydrolase
MKKNQISFQFISEPTDVNFGGKVHGGMVMKWIDQTAFACASNWAEGYCVTVYVGGIKFYKPIQIGEVVKIDAQIIYTGNTSMHIACDVLSRPITGSKFVKTTHCIIVFVCVDDKGNPKPIKKWVPKTEEDISMEGYAKRLMDLRKQIEVEMEPYIKGH